MAPAGYREVPYTGAGGGTCWEPTGDVGFNPNLNDVLLFVYQRGSSEYPQPRTVVATNPSYGLTYKVTLFTNPDIRLAIGQLSGLGTLSFNIGPRESKEFTVNVTPELLEDLGDGRSTLLMSVDIQQV